MKNTFLLFIIFVLPGSLAAATNPNLCQSALISTTPDERFTEQVDPSIVYDRRTGLFWQRCPLGLSYDAVNNVCSGTMQYSYTEALNQALALDNGDPQFAWRLPNIKELASIAERKCAKPALNLNIFYNFDERIPLFWSSTVKDSQHVYIINFENGTTDLRNPDLNASVRLVADGP
ncbi:MAG: DUF1566 domain-containing protein [Gammaproteobacteria bacterium]|nr:DUF1566 domain-containing protein [Gammaproteobacteria bacterium]MDH5728243.1 DUF1566 domain-containing protein [Gammaproteobacteria bacterium]